MTADPTYRDYVSDVEHMRQYSTYQRQYATSIRESDKVLIEMVRSLIRDRLDRGERPRLLDIGCSTGNLLLHLKRLIPGLSLTGGDLAPAIVGECRANPALAGIDFSEMNMLELDRRGSFDVIVANAALMFFTEDEFKKAIGSIARALRDGGWFVAFDLFHAFEQEVAILETTRMHPRGLKFYFRSYARVQEAVAAAQLGPATFRPFDIPIDLPRPSDPADVTSYTVATADGARMSFRCSLYQPWCHVVAPKP